MTDGGGTGPWGARIVRSELDSSGAEEDPSVTADRLVVVWSSDRPGTGDHDLWTATRPSPRAPFDPPEELVGLNSAVFEGSPELSPDGLTLFFRRT